MTDTVRERMSAARKSLKGDNSTAPSATVRAAAVNLGAALAGGGDTTDEQAVEEFIKRTRNGAGGGPGFPSPFGRLDLLLLAGVLLAVYYYILVKHNVDLWPHIWHYIGPHYDHHDAPIDLGGVPEYNNGALDL